VKVVVAVACSRVPAWHGWCIDALRAQRELTVQVLQVDAQPWEPPRGLEARLAGRALAPVEIAVTRGDAAGADVVVDLTGAVRDDRAPQGVWSFRLGENGEGTLPFVREIAAGAKTFEIALERRSGGRRETLRSGRFGVTRWYPSTLRLAFAQAARWPALLAAVAAAGAPVDALDDEAPPQRPAAPAFERLRFVTSLGTRLAGAVSTALLDVVEWNVGFVEGGPRRLLSAEPLEVRWLPRPDPMTFIADPFVVERDGVRALFVESYEYERDRGTIEALVLDEHDQVVRRAPAIDIPTHLSYPYPVEIDGELYLVPENCAGNEVALYRCERFPDRWQREAALFPAFDGVDTTLFSHEGRWWAFCTRYSHGSTLALNLFHAGSPRGPWSPHALNPVVVDVSSARPAGRPFLVDGVLYRPGQDCSESYGGGLAIARVDELTPTAYREKIVCRHDARSFGRWNGGIHTVSFTRGQVVVDGKLVYRDLRKLPRVARKIGSSLGRLVTRRAQRDAFA
jgi:hypothetical protein